MSEEHEHDEQDSVDQGSVDRRAFLRRAGMVGAAAWSIPVIHTLSASPAFAQTGTPPTTTTDTTAPQTFCGHSVGGPDGGGCMSACTDESTGCKGSQCNGFGTGDFSPCDIGCGGTTGTGNDNPCCNPGLCDSANFSCDGDPVDASYCGPTVGCANIPFVCVPV